MLWWIALVAGCGSGGAPSGNHTSSSVVHFAVIADPHLYDCAVLGGVSADGTVTSQEFAEYLHNEITLLAESEQILDNAVAGVLETQPDFVLIPGDLTKDGELQNHMRMVQKLALLKSRGVRVYVIPGNHDINNPQALSYANSPPTRVSAITPVEFRSLYYEYGYGVAITVDPDSLSYIAEPVPGVWLFAIDACRYDNNSNRSSAVVGGSVRTTTRTWLLQWLGEARRQGKYCIGMMHHGLIEHYNNQTSLFPDYVVDDYRELGRMLAEAGLTVMFTGHFHSNDISSQAVGNDTMYDIATGSLLTWPNAYRFIALDQVTGVLALTTMRVSATATHPVDFAAYSRNYLKMALMGLIPEQLAAYPSLIPYTDLIADSMLAHFAGDESPDEAIRSRYTAMLFSLNLTTMVAGQIIADLWRDTYPPDNSLIIPLARP